MNRGCAASFVVVPRPWWHHFTTLPLSQEAAGWHGRNKITLGGTDMEKVKGQCVVYFWASKVKVLILNSCLD